MFAKLTNMTGKTVYFSFGPNLVLSESDFGGTLIEVLGRESLLRVKETPEQVITALKNAEWDRNASIGLASSSRANTGPR